VGSSMTSTSRTGPSVRIDRKTCQFPAARARGLSCGLAGPACCMVALDGGIEYNVGIQPLPR
jgi:hypothetical protein